MIRLSVGTAVVASLLAATGAFAADLPARTYTKAPVAVDPGYNWTGFYAGLNGGYSWGRASETASIGAPFPATAVATVRQNVNGGLGGGQVGYNWQIDRTWLVGLEADIQGTGERGRSTDILGAIRVGAVGATVSTTVTTDFPWFATFRGRAGILADPSLLFYGTGGLAVGEVRITNQPSVTVQLFDGNTPIGAPVTVAAPTVSGSQTRVGWTVGAGMEKKFDPNWSAKVEYLYLDLGKTTYFRGTGNDLDVSFRDNIFRAGINYAFSPAPVVARY